MKKTLAVFSILLAFSLLFCACSSPASNDASTDKQQSPNGDVPFDGGASLSVKDADGQEYTIDKELLSTLTMVQFETTQGKSGEEPTTNTHAGILLKDVLEKAGVKTDGITQLNCKSIDGFSKAYTKENLDDPEKLFLTFQMDGELLKYQDKDCFYIVAKNEQFKQNWTKFLESIEIS